MGLKDFVHALEPVQLYIVLILSIIYFLIQLFFSHITHALTLLVNSYHMLCNIIALTGCIITINYSTKASHPNATCKTEKPTKDNENANHIEVYTSSGEQRLQHINESGMLRNTFGWTRIDLLTMMIVCIFLAAFCFSLLVEALQTLIHINYADTMHHPIPVLIIGAAGLILNGLCYLLIGGYTFHQGSFLHITSSGNVVLDRVVSEKSIQKGERRLSRTKKHPVNIVQESRHRQSYMEISRDVCSCIFVIGCSLIVFFIDNEKITKFIDPVISIISCIVLIVLSYPYMKESGLILLQTIPGSIDIENFKNTLLKTFPDIESVHDLHIWQLTRSKYVSTAHVIFQDPKTYARVMEDVLAFFRDQGITIVTVQPEFKVKSQSMERRSPANCLFGCRDNSCMDKYCCKSDEDLVPEICLGDTKENSSTNMQQSVGNKEEENENVSISLKNISQQFNSYPLRRYKSEPHLSTNEQHIQRISSEVD
uniref:Putative zinc transporter 1 isoform x2 n=1 Tax=Lutzomyia longipalpis TaxID=7200 RepID=A0A7G3B545_LUTLO